LSVTVRPPLAGDDTAVILAAARLRGELRLPGDKSISHRALILAALAAGQSHITGAGDGADVRSTATVASALGADVERQPGVAGTVDYRVSSPGAHGLQQPNGTLDCGNSGTTLRLFAGALAGLPVTCVLDGDASLRRRPVGRIIAPLRTMGATIHGDRDDTLPPVTVVGRSPLRAAAIRTPVPSAQVKSAILLAGLRADGETTVRESVATRDHTERMLRSRGVPVRSEGGPDGSMTIALTGPAPVRPSDERVPGDISSAAFWLVAGAAHPDAELVLRDVGINPTRRAVIDLLRRMGADISESAVSDHDGDLDVGEPIADLTVRSSSLHGTDLDARDVASAIDEIPVMCIAAAVAAGVTRIRGAGELRHKESDRLVGIAAGLTALGARIEVDRDDLTIHGGRRLSGAETDSLTDHRLTMAFAVAGLVATGTTTVRQASSASISYPAFFSDLERIRA
jgi:3-phosphoshikimate 1-carboxyvinyltransferase